MISLLRNLAENCQRIKKIIFFKLQFNMRAATGFYAVRIFRAGYFPPFSSRNRLRMISATELPFCLLSSHDKMSR